MFCTPLQQKHGVKNVFALANYLNDVLTGILGVVTKLSPAL